MNWCLNTGGLTGCLLCRDRAVPLLSLTLCLLSLFSTQRGMSASMPTPSSVGSVSRLEPNVAGAQTQYVDRNRSHYWVLHHHAICGALNRLALKHHIILKTYWYSCIFLAEHLVWLLHNVEEQACCRRQHPSEVQSVQFELGIHSLISAMQDFLKQGETVSTRCDELQSLKKRGCADAMIENPRGGQRILKNKKVTNRSKGEERREKLRPEDITQIQPQKLSLTLRSGEEWREKCRNMTEILLWYSMLIRYGGTFNSHFTILHNWWHFWRNSLVVLLL